MNFSAVALLMIVSTGFGPPALAEVSKSPPPQVKSCESCHGKEGNSTDLYTPRLNGQPSAYLLNRLRELTDFKKETPHATTAMFSQAHRNANSASQFADYFSRQKATPARPQPGASSDEGARLVAEGDPSNDVKACASCHGPGAVGLGAAPRLAGQHKSYLETQLWDLFLKLRQNSTMHPVAGRLSADQIRALINYLGAD